jgi:ubiquinone/menaquinone biosynthesis C-methylase UbiE
MWVFDKYYFSSFDVRLIIQDMIKNEVTVPKTDEDLKIRSQMEKMVDSYDKYMRRITLGREKVLRTMTVSLAQIRPDDCILEVGCGTGTLTIEAKRKAGTKHKAEKAGLDISFQVGSIDNIPFPDGQFDVVMCSFMIFHMSEKVRNKGIEEIYRVLRPEGRFLILDLSLPQKPLPRSILKLILGFMLKHDLKDLIPIMNAAGFSKAGLGQAKFRVFGLPLLSYVLGVK